MNIADRERQWMLQFQPITGAYGTIRNLHSNYFDYRGTFQTVLDLYGVNIADREP